MRLRRLALLAVIAALPGVARGQDALTFAHSLSNPVAGGYYVGPYSATFTPAIGQASGISIICVDFLNHVGYDDHYGVNVTRLGAASSLVDTRHPGQLDAYRKAAWMGSLFQIAPQDYWGSIQYAIWNVFTPADAPDDALSPYVAQAADVAASHGYGAFDYYGVHFDAVDMSRWSVVTDVAAAGLASGGHQEFLTSDIPSAAVPEPATVALVGTGFGAVMLVMRRRRRVRQESRLD
jgi:hypothetical protein